MCLSQENSSSQKEQKVQEPWGEHTKCISTRAHTDWYFETQ